MTLLSFSTAACELENVGVRRLAGALLAGGCQVFSLTYHSPSLMPGHTPYVYVRGEADLERLIATVHDDCAWFRDRGGGEFMSLSQLRRALAARR